MFELAKTEYDTCKSVQDALQFVNVKLGHASKQWVAIVKSRTNNDAGHSLGYFVWQGLTDMTEGTDVTVAGSAYIGNMPTKCKLAVEGDAQASDCWWRLNSSSRDMDNVNVINFVPTASCVELNQLWFAWDELQAIVL